MKLFRLIVGPLSVAIAFAALVSFDSVSRALLFLSPDRDVTGFMLLLLRLVLLSLGAVGLFLLAYERAFKLIRRLDFFLSAFDRRKFLLFALSTAFLLRLVVVLVMPLHLWADYASYDDLGWQWAQKGGYYNGDFLTAYWPPGYPFLLSRLYLVFGHAPQAAVVVNLLFGTLIVLLTYLIIERTWQDRTARWSTVIMVLFPSQLFFANLLASEILFTFLLLTVILSIIMGGGKGRKSVVYALVSGLLLGLAALTRSIVQPVLLLAVLYWLARTRNWKRAVALSLVATGACAIVVVPWMLRNREAVGAAVINTNAGINLYMGNQPSSGMGYNAPLADEFDVNDPRQEAYIDSVTKARALQYIVAEPLLFLKRGVVKLAFFYAVDMDALDFGLLQEAEQSTYGVWGLAALVTESYYLIVLLVCGLGLTLAFSVHAESRSAEAYLLLAVIVYWSAVHFVFYGMGRYHFPVIPLISAFAALFIVHRLNCRIKK